MLRASLVLLVFGALVQGQSISEILYGKKGSLDAHVHYDPDLLDNLLKKNYGQIVDEDWSRYNQLQVFMAFIDASCTLPEGKRAAGAAALAHQGYFAGESDAAAAGLDGLGLRGLARFQKNYQEALARFGADKCGESSIKIIESLVEMINKRREATPNGTPAPNEPPPYRQVLDRESFELLKQALESKGW